MSLGIGAHQDREAQKTADHDYENKREKAQLDELHFVSFLYPDSAAQQLRSTL